MRSSARTFSIRIPATRHDLMHSSSRKDVFIPSLQWNRCNYLMTGPGIRTGSPVLQRNSSASAQASEQHNKRVSINFLRGLALASRQERIRFLIAGTWIGDEELRQCKIRHMCA